MELLQQKATRMLADIRRYPGSRRQHPFLTAVARILPPRAPYRLRPFRRPRRRRKPLADSPNRRIRNEQFRGYADYMATPQFAAAVDRLLAIGGRTAVMCAERCDDDRDHSHDCNAKRSPPGPDARVVLDARWSLSENGRVDVTRHEHIAVDIASLDSTNIASGMSRALASLADRIRPHRAITVSTSNS